MNEVTNTTATAIEQEMICDKVDRLARELSEALPQWVNGQFMAMVYPAGDVRGYWFRSMTRDENGEKTDPVIAAVQDYRDGCARFNAINSADWPLHGGEDAVIEKTYGGPMAALENWGRPCTSRDGAIAALRHALAESEDIYCSDSIGPMLRAALGYLEGASA
ncbi:hypothetical protein [Agrobacterium tumefaciens]|uniref:hypothetical protein n=1 Tax=Agrobacterium tumefaciens TaxID=358 RepID=UPI001573BD23|nr:hypothetical protein [Agrobacterium tumefaciens]NSX91475.1 hypothetical protein [Agrobacterium tumefaciens]